MCQTVRKMHLARPFLLWNTLLFPYCTGGKVSQVAFLDSPTALQVVPKPPTTIQFFQHGNFCNLLVVSGGPNAVLAGAGGGGVGELKQPPRPPAQRPTGSLSLPAGGAAFQACRGRGAGGAQPGRREAASLAVPAGKVTSERSWQPARLALPASLPRSSVCLPPMRLGAVGPP